MPSIATFNKVNVETIVSLKPDLVLGEEGTNPADQLRHLQEIGLPVLVLKTSSLAGIRESIGLVARAMASEKEGAGLLKNFDDGLRRVDERARSRKTHPRVLLELTTNR